MSASLESVEVVVVPDDDPDPSYLCQGLGFEDRRAAYEAGEFGFVGVKAVARIRVPNGSGWILETIETPGLWGIEDDSGDEYIADVGKDELSLLKEILDELGVKGGVASERER